MSDNEANEPVSEPEVSDAESEVLSVNEDDLIEENNSDAEETENDEESKKKPKPSKPKPEKKAKVFRDDDDDEDIDEMDDEDDNIDDLEIKPFLIEEAKSLTQRFSIVIDPRNLEDHVKPNPKIKREIIVNRKNYKSSEYLQLYEFCELIGIRSQHISDGADVYIDIEAETTAREIAKKELQFGKCPFLVKRYMTPMSYDPVYVEIWDPNDMAINSKFFDT
jgi:hypothetical protein